MTRCNIHTDKTLKYIYERQGWGQKQILRRLNIGKVCITCLVAVATKRTEAVK